MSEHRHLVPPRLDEFRRYYVRTIRPELLRLDVRRRRILRGIFVSLLLIAAAAVVFASTDLGFLNLLLIVPVVFYVGHLYYRLEKFRQAFKPAVVQLILNFLNEGLNFRSLTYDPNKPILRDRFERSGLFRPDAASYRAEDYIRGIVGEMAFEMGETYVRELSPASNRIQLVFSGLFVHAVFNEPVRDQVAVWPRRQRRRLKRVIDSYVSQGGRVADVEIHNADFREVFAVYAKKGSVVKDIITPPMQDALLDFHRQTGRDLYFSINRKDLFIGLAHDYDLLEPNLFRSNVKYTLIRRFYDDITLMLGVIADFDQNR